MRNYRTRPTLAVFWILDFGSFLDLGSWISDLLPPGMKRATNITLLLLLIAFLAGLVKLFHLRFEAGDVYPEYSSLRSDPLGAKALHESLENLVDVQRNYRQLTALDSYDKAAVLFLGVPPGELECEAAAFKAIEAFVRGGGRLVIALLPSYDQPPTGPRGPRPPAAAQSDPDATPPVSLTNAWNFTVAYSAVSRDIRGVYKPARATLRSEWETNELPENIDIHTARFFDNSDGYWDVAYERQGNRAVVMERKVGSGTIVLAADSYYFSNEALLKNRQPELLSWFIGQNQKVVFDETHLGVTESPGVAALARKYRLHGLFAGLLLLAALFVWKNSSSLIPRDFRDELSDASEVVVGRDAAAGFVNIMRRNIRRQDLLGLCLDEWKQTCSQQVTRTRLEAIQRIIDEDNARDEHDPVRVYRAISQTLHDRRLRLAKE